MKAQLAFLMVAFALADAPVGQAQNAVTLPKPDPAFKGKIGTTYQESTPDYPRPGEAPADAPNDVCLGNVRGGEDRTAGQETGFESEVWELYDLSKDFSEAHDLAAQHPDKLKELQDAFDVEARKYNVFPLDDRMAGRFDQRNRPNALAGLTSFTYGPGVGYISESATLNTHNVAFSVTAELEADDEPANGVLAAIGGKTSGWSLYVKDGRPTFYYNFFEIAGYRAQSSTLLSKGKHTVRVEFNPEEKGYGKPAAVKLFVDGEQTGTVRVEKTVPVGYSGEGFDVGADNISAVSRDYKSPFAFTGKIKGVTIAVEQLP